MHLHERHLVLGGDRQQFVEPAVQERLGTERQRQLAAEGEDLLGDALEVGHRDLLLLAAVECFVAEVAHDAAEVALVDDVHFHGQRPDPEVRPELPEPDGIPAAFQGRKEPDKMQQVASDVFGGRGAEEELRVGSPDLRKQGLQDVLVCGVVLQPFTQLLRGGRAGSFGACLLRRRRVFLGRA